MLCVNPYTAPGSPTDPYFANVVTLLHCNGANGSTTFTDQIGKTYTAYGNAQISTAQSLFNGSSGLFDGTGDYIDTPWSDDFNINSGSGGTIEFAFRLSILAAACCPIGNRQSGGTGWEISFDTDGTVYVQSQFGFIATAASIVTTATWQHMMLTTDIGTSQCTAYIDGVCRASGALSLIHNTTQGLTIGRRGFNATQHVAGNIAEIRITKGVQRATGTTVGVTYFTPPAAPHPDA